MKRIAMVCAAVVCVAGPATAHEFWIAPSNYRATAGDTVAIRNYVGTGFRGELKPYAPTRAIRFTLRSARELDLTRAARNGDLVMARFVVTDGGGSLVAYESNFADIELPAAEFDRYVEVEGLDHVRAARAKAPSSAGVRERYARCPKTWIAGDDSARVTRPAGLTYELVPLTAPGAAPTLKVRVLFRGRPLAGALVRGWNHSLADSGRPTDPAARDSIPALAQARTDPHGLATLTLDRPGEWLLSSVHMVPSADREQADWESFWASLTFAKTRP